MQNRISTGIKVFGLYRLLSAYFVFCHIFHHLVAGLIFSFFVIFHCSLMTSTFYMCPMRPPIIIDKKT